jgi:hypothetical protein
MEEGNSQRGIDFWGGLIACVYVCICTCFECEDMMLLLVVVVVGEWEREIHSEVSIFLVIDSHVCIYVCIFTYINGRGKLTARYRIVWGIDCVCVCICMHF